MKAELKSLYSPDLDDLEHESPPDPENFRVLVQALIGDTNSDASESFNIAVCTPSWLEQRLARDGHVWGRHYLFVPRYDYGMIEDLIRTLCDSTEGSDWEQIATILSRFGAWEFEDYQG